MKIKRIFAGVLAGAMCLTLFAGCKKNEVVVGEQVTLKYVMAGPGMQEDAPIVWEAFNKKLHEKLPNVSVEFEVVPLKEYKEKVRIMMSAREQIDIVNNYGLDFAMEVSNGSFAPLNDLLDEYGKEIREVLPEWLGGYETIDGNIYGVPTYQMMGKMRCFCTIKDYADKYLDVEALKAAFVEEAYFSQKVYDILTDYCVKAKADGVNFKTVTILNLKGYEEVSGSYGVRYGDEGCKIVNAYANEESMIRFKTANEWFNAGYIRKDALYANDDDNYKGKLDGMLFWDEVYTPYVADALTKRYGVEIMTIPYEVEPYITFQETAGGTSIVSSSNYKEEAMQVINLIQTDKELYNLLVFGIEGKNYKKVDEDRIEVQYSSSPTPNVAYGLYKWIVGNTELAYNIQSEPEEYKKWVFEEVNSSNNKSFLAGFHPDTTQIQDMILQTNLIKEQYLQPLNVGVVPDWEANYAEYREKLVQAGEEQIIAELQKQVDEFLQNKERKGDRE